MTTASPPRSPGRPRQFDEDGTLDAITALFWHKGFEATSMSDVVEASGMSKSSLYNAFGSKHELFALILERYIDQRMEGLTARANAAGDGVQGLHHLLDAVRDFGEDGCLAVNATAELGTNDALVVSFGHEYRGRMRAALREAVSIATAKAGLAADLVNARADLLLGFLLGLAVTIRGGAGEEEIDRFMVSAHQVVESWRD